ncbi:putative F-box/LRR-repeat protein [Camellia lanceoleosa]|uniref:F-box/LRR-repeat protein n=1 Tax=Camellia lanceoleosa TaxID=1840588 RepID=A0ACC0IC87_9ERIC|nr:putative F-box/LRR-repeat protein [Camellia lanceoleosa]
MSGRSHHSDSSSDDLPLPKRPKTRRNRTTVVDRMSMLPDFLLIHILSFLPTIEDAIKTDVLSKRWQYLWTSLPSLLFSYPDIGEDFDYWERIADFVAFVDKTLVLCNCSKLKKFVVEFEYDSRFASNVNLWTRFATRNATEELQLQFYTAAEGLKEEDRFVLPQLLFTNSSFRELSFCFCSVVPKRVVDWKLLKKLSIGYVELSDDVIQKILEGTPVLEILELYYFYGFTRLHVNQPSLKKLILRRFWHSRFWDSIEDEEGGIDNEHDFTIEISAPHLQSLEISGSFWIMCCLLADVSSLVDATLNCNFECYDDHRHHDYEWYQNILRLLLRRLVHVKKLTVGSWVLQLLSIMEMKGLHSPLSKCECLTLDTHIEESVLAGIANILESSSHLETLVITMSPSRNDEYSYNDLSQPFNFNGEHYWTSQKKVFECLMMRLKIVKFAGLGWNCCDFYFSFVQFLLKNSRVLQKMVIKVDCIPLKEHFQAAQRLLSFPRSSSDAVIMFN